MYLAHQLYPEDSIGLYNAYLDATRRPHGYFILDLTQDTNGGLRFRTNNITDRISSGRLSDIGDQAVHVLKRPNRDCVKT